jgi:hypothetical protein
MTWKVVKQGFIVSVVIRWASRSELTLLWLEKAKIGALGRKGE